MRMTIQQAFRNVVRNKRRSALTVASIVAGVVSIIVIGGYYEYNYWGLRESLIRSQYAHIQLTVPGYFSHKEENPFHYLIPGYQRLTRWLAQQPEVAAVSPRLDYWALLNAGSESSLVQVRGVIPEQENLINTFFTHKEGADLRSTDRGAAELGYGLAQHLHVGIGEKFYLTAVGPDGSQNALQFVAKSIVGSYSETFDQTIVRLPLPEAESLAGIQGVQEIAVLLNRTADTQPFRSYLERNLPAMGYHLTVSTWEQRAGYYGKVVEFYGGYFRVILLIVAIVAFFSTLNTMLMSILERTREIGTVRTFGMRPSQLLLLFLLEGALLGIAGTGIGIVVAVVAATVVNAFGGIPMSAPPGLTTSVMVQIIVTGSDILLASAMGLVVPLIAAFIPAARAARISIIDQIRDEK